MQVLSDEVKRKQYDTYGSAGFDAGQAGGGQHYWSGQTTSIDPEELFRKIFGEFSGARGFGDFNAMFDQPQEVRRCKMRVNVKAKTFQKISFVQLEPEFAQPNYIQKNKGLK